MRLTRKLVGGICCRVASTTSGTAPPLLAAAFVGSPRRPKSSRLRSSLPLPRLGERTRSFLSPAKSLLYSTSNLQQQGEIQEEEPTSSSFGLNKEDTIKLEDLVERRSKARWQGNYAEADEIREQIQEKISVPPGYEVLLTDIPRKEGGGSSWKLLQRFDQPSPATSTIVEGPTVLQLAHAALGLAIELSLQSSLDRAHLALGKMGGAPKESSISTETEQEDRLQCIVDQAKQRLDDNSSRIPFQQYELSGRKAADAAFWFALAGVADPYLFDTLVKIATKEMARFGERPSCRAKDIFQIMERFAAAGIQSAPELEQVAQRCLSLKALPTLSYGETTTAKLDSLLDFHSDRSLLLIWKFSTKQKKQRAFLQSALKHWERHKETDEQLSRSEYASSLSPPRSAAAGGSKIQKERKQEHKWDVMFADTSRPLVVDIGCGMGVSLLGLAKSSRNGTHSDFSSARVFGEDSSTLLSDCNFVGVDLGALAIGYARGLASRWGLENRLQFVVDSAEEFVEEVGNSYPGPVCLVLIQFPTPYRLLKPVESPAKQDTTGNTQLPTSAQDGFMVSEKLLRLVHLSLSKTNGSLLLQSNCEDVAVWMRKLACENIRFALEYESLDGEIAVFVPSPITPRVPQRTADWVAMGGERATGPGWFKKSLLHRLGVTETEVACALNGTPVHRCLLRPSHQDGTR